MTKGNPVVAALGRGALDEREPGPPRGVEDEGRRHAQPLMAQAPMLSTAQAAGAGARWAFS